MYKYLFIIGCFLSLSAWSEETRKIVCLISPPRSLSVGFMRMIETRGDFKIFHEPVISVYHAVNHYAFSNDDDWFRKEAFQTFDEVKKAIFQEKSHVFIKEMSFSLAQFVDEEFIKNPDIYFVFLMRHPRDGINSLYGRIRSIVEDFHIAVGYQAAYDVFHKIKVCGVREPLVLFSEELASHPETAIKEFCAYVGIPFKKEALSWDPLKEDFDGQDAWHETKRGDMTRYWHGDAIWSSGFKPLKTYATDEHGYPTFSEVTNLKDREECLKAYENSLPYYQFFQSIDRVN